MPHHSGRRTQESRGGKQPALVVAREKLRKALGSGYELKAYVTTAAGRPALRYGVLETVRDEHGNATQRILAAGHAPALVVAQAIAALRP